MNKFQSVINQVELFIRKYYKNQMVKGGIFFLGLLMLSYFAVVGVEYLGRFSSGVRLFLLLAFIGLNSFLLIKFLIIPLLKLYKVGQRLSIIEAADMLGGIFPEVGDKLKNTIQLKSDQSALEMNLDLVNASIEQRAEKLSVVPFSGAIDIRENKRYLKYLLPVLLLIIGVALFNPGWFTDGTKRVVYFDQEFIEPAPFEFQLASEQDAIEGDNYNLKIKLVGEEIPEEVKVYTNKGNYNLKKTSAITFEHEFLSLSEGLSFYCVANGFESQNFDISILRKPIVENIELAVSYPKHTGLKSEVFNNTGAVSVPEGSLIEWRIDIKNLKQMNVLFKDTIFGLNTSISDKYSFSRRFLNTENYALALSSEDIVNADTLNYAIGVIKDAYPNIVIKEEIDSSNILKRFIQGQISDDYGFKSLSMVIQVEGDSAFSTTESIGVNSKAQKQLFSYYLDLTKYKLSPGDRVSYTLIVRDNDEINGYKSASSGRRAYQVPELDELENQLGEKDEKLKEDMDEASKDAKELREEIKKLKSEMLNKSDLDWRDKQRMENLMNMQKDLEKQMEDMKKNFDQNNEEKENFMENSEELQKKQEELEKLLEELMDDELKELFEELEKLMEEMDRDKMIQNMEEMEKNAEDMEEKLDRTLELFKNMELDQKLENLEEQLRKLAEEQEALKEANEEKKMAEEKLSEEQERLNDKFDEVQKDIDEIQEKNEDLESPRDLDFKEEQEEQTDQEMQDAQENLENGKSKKSQQNQQKASDMLQQMADDAAAMKSASQQQQAQEDMDALRFLLENLIHLSHDQEGLMDEFYKTSTKDPCYLDLNREQLAIKKATEIVDDSLVALAKRVSELSSMITEELNDLSYNLDKSMFYSEERKTRTLNQHQQYSMTSYNNLALMLSEVLDQMQQQAKMKMPGNGSCNNPGGQGSGQSQQQMTMEQMKEALKNQIGKMKGGQKPGGEEGKGQDGNGMGEMPGGEQGSIPQLSPKEKAKMAAEQGRLRESLKQLKQELNKDGSGAGNGLDEVIKELDKLQNDLLNNQVGSDYVKRQEDIYTRLLESEKAIRERGFSEEREAKEGKNQEDGNLNEFTEYNKKKEAEVEFLRSLPVGLRQYYKSLVNDYFNAVNNE